MIVVLLIRGKESGESFWLCPTLSLSFSGLLARKEARELEDHLQMKSFFSEHRFQTEMSLFQRKSDEGGNGVPREGI